ncbi:2-hydroxyhepta-2,4-diene-1,7-dioate isomerase [Vulcanimicrobium alpinum]|uniref:2-hydroxyhepta-2,4-diene-1,7-dioate isomerase n=1 Tax=Vulcanimicrobium alpinum TaxID=3016050 RepID=A0AAN2CAC9_UNVUL|nr:fumarylacetoacetate hydrolase family protein [Vulcanimicrobium alpinum]BDE06537.1 2-hydroxyhepta-2,4-diene-1,7-dioate isomerase [Vulcanimicrobium alpinum]
MQFVTFEGPGGERTAGIEDGGFVVPARAFGAYGAGVRELIGLPEAHLDEIFAAAANLPRHPQAIPLSEVHLGPPVPDPDKIICLGLNYRDHAEETGLKPPRAPILFPKYRNSLAGPFDEILVPPAAAGRLDYEAELAVVIGRRASRVAEADAPAFVGGYAAFNDLSARDLQMLTSQWAAGKAVDGFAPMGPGIVPARFVADPQNLPVIARVNGGELQHGNTREMIFSIAQTIAFITSFMTLEPGDIIATGTPAGVGFTRTPPVALGDGDVVEIEIPGVGTIRNTMRVAAAVPSA